MDLQTVNKTTYKAEKPVEGWDSLIWTERYTGNGEFELRTPLVAEVKALLPEDSLCCILQSNELMWVETHDIQVDEDDNDVLIVKGRSFDSFFEKRAIYGTHKAEWKTPVNYNQYQAPAALLWNFLQQTSGVDRLRPTFYGLTTRDIIPNMVVAHSPMGTANPVFTGVEWWLETGGFDPQFRDWLIRGGMGIRTIRPNGPRKTDPHYDVQIATNGTWGSGTLSTTDTRLILDIYNGKNRIPGGIGLDERVIFSHAQGHITSSNYVASVKDQFTMAHVSTSVGNVDVYAPEYSDGLVSGFDRKVMFIDGGDVGDQNPTAFIQAMIQKGEIELAKHRRSFVFDGEFSTDPYKFGIHYDLGDRVRVMGQYGFIANMMVSEYVRTEDADGERGFPSLVLY